MTLQQRAGPYTSGMAGCPACGADNGDDARFCQRCGTALGTWDDRIAVGARKVVSVVFTDVAGFTGLSERLDPELVRRVMDRYFDAMQAAVLRHGGVVEKFIGDAVMAVFGVPRLHEDDALRAVRAAADMRAALAELNAELEARYGVRLEARTGVNTGEVLAADPAAPSAAIMGDAVNVAARLEQTAEPGQIVLGETTYRIVRDAVVVESRLPVTLKGKSQPVSVHLLVSVDPATIPPWRMDSPLVGREDELALLARAFRDAVDGDTAVRLVLLGPAGIGKSRTAMEFVAGLGEGVRVLQGRCLPYGEGITFWAAREIVKQAFEIGDTDSADQVRQRIYAVVPESPEAVLLGDGVTELLGLSEARVGMEETFWAMRRLLELAAATQPLVLVLDDIHWAEPAFLDLIDYLVGWTEGAPILFLCLGRPELLDARPSWRRRAPREWSVALEPLREEESATLLANLMAQGEMAAEARTRILEAAEGNPLFVEEMLRMLADDDLLRPEAGRWRPVRDLSDLAVPPTINALIGARLDRLGPGERAVTRRASVIGKVFWWGAVAELSPTDERSVVGGHLQTLVRKELVQPERSRMEGEDAFRFHHLLIRDAAYQGTPKAERADLHRRFAGWLERVAADRVAEYEEVIGYHLEQAVRYRAELEPAATKTDRELASRAANRLASAGRRAFGRGDMSAAANLLGRAALLLPADDSVRLNLMPDLAEALMEEGDLSQAAGVLDEVAERAGAAGLARIEGHATIVRLLLAESTDPESRSDLALKELERVIPVFQELGDHLGLARSYRLTADVHWSRARYAACDEALLLAADHARKAGAVREETECLAQLAGSGLYGPAPVAEVVRRCEEIRATSGGRPAAEARALRTLAACVAMEGRFDEGRELANRSYEMLNELGLRLRASFATEAAAFVETLAGDHAAAERALRRGFEITEEVGERGYNATVTALLSQAVFAQGRVDEAESLTRAAERNGATDDMTTQVVWRSVRARVLSTRGRHADAEALGREAASLAGETDDVNMRADALLDLASVLRPADQPEEAETRVREALAIYEAKGNEVSAERTRALLSGGQDG
jgi:class 3 adenylate cyclase/tetratricopeptide (TPR) repeat protein